MIQIITGTFGYYNGRKVIPITNADGPQKFDPELEARLVKKGVAKYVDEIKNASDTNVIDNDPEYSEKMKLEDLKKVATLYGVDASSMRKKTDVIEAIEEAKANEEPSSGDEESPPQLDAADPV